MRCTLTEPQCGQDTSPPGHRDASRWAMAVASLVNSGAVRLAGLVMARSPKPRSPKSRVLSQVYNCEYRVEIGTMQEQSSRHFWSGQKLVRKREALRCLRRARA